MSDWSSDVCSSDLNELRHHRDDSSEDHRPAEPYPLGGETEGERAGRDRRHQRALGCAQAAPVADLLDREARKRAYNRQQDRPHRPAILVFHALVMHDHPPVATTSAPPSRRFQAQRSASTGFPPPPPP